MDRERDRDLGDRFERERRREFDGSPFENDDLFRYGGLALAGALAVCLTFWLAVQIASLLHFDWVPLGKGLSSAPKAIAGLVRNPTDPSAGYSPSIAPLVAPAWLLYPVLAGLVFLEARYGLRGYRWFRRWRAPGGDVDHTRWATEDDLAVISDTRKNANLDQGVVLAVSQKGKPIYLERQSHAVVVAGTRSGKTAGLCIPALLTYPGAIIATSVKNDLVSRTIEHRSQMGEVFVFDPVRTTGLSENSIAGWTPLEASKDWHGAQRTAAALVDVAMSKKSGGGSDNLEFFKRMSAQTLPVLLFASAAMEQDMRRVMRWMHWLGDKGTQQEIEGILRWADNVRALDSWHGFLSREPRLRDSIAATMESALVSYEDEAVLHNAMRCDITPERFFNGEANTLYVCAPMAEQSRLEPVFVALMQDLLLWVTAQPEPLEMPLLGVFDEAGNIAALPLLPEILSTAGSQNVSILTSWQDFSQIRARYGSQWNTILNNSRAKLVLPGVADPETIGYFTNVTGETVEDQVSISGGQHHRQLSVGQSRRSLLTPATIREQRLGDAILVYGHLPPSKVRLRMYFSDPELSARARGAAPTGSSGRAVRGTVSGAFSKAGELAAKARQLRPQDSPPASPEQRAAEDPWLDDQPPSFRRLRGGD